MINKNAFTDNNIYVDDRDTARLLSQCAGDSKKPEFSYESFADMKDAAGKVIVLVRREKSIASGGLTAEERDLMKDNDVMVLTDQAVTGNPQEYLAAGAVDVRRLDEDLTTACEIIRRVWKETNQACFDAETRMYNCESFLRFGENLRVRNPSRHYAVALFELHNYRKALEAAAPADSMKTLETIKSVIFEIGKETNGGISCRYDDHRFAVLFPDDLLGKDEWAVEKRLEEYVERLETRCSDTEFHAAACLNLTGFIPDENETIVQTACKRVLDVLETIYRDPEGKKVTVYTMDDEYLVKHLDDIIHNGELQVYYQPKHDALTGYLAGAEVFGRWVKEENGEKKSVSLGKYVNLLTQKDLMHKADFYSWESAVKMQKKWLDQGLEIVPISLNFERSDLTREDFLPRVSNAVESCGLDPRYVHVEVTEKDFSVDERRLKSILKELQGMGIKIEMDDFGKENSTLTSLSNMPFDVLKLDVAFLKLIQETRRNSIKGVTSEESKRATLVISCVAMMAKMLNMKTVIEGVENEDIRDRIPYLGVDYIQGYVYSQPISAEKFEAYLREYQGQIKSL